VRIILHAGLHKSGTTSVQASWRAAYGEHDGVWYPRRDRGGPPGHHDLFRPLLTAFTERRDPDLISAGLAWSLRPPGGPSLAGVLAEARARGVATLVLSSEDLDRVREEDRAGLHEVLGGQDVTLVVTATRPVHRWCSGWQTLVKHGLADYPREAATLLLEFSAVRSGRLRELIALLPATRRVVRLVRSVPPEPELAADLAEWLGLPEPERAAGHPVRNPSLSTDTEILLRLNRADLALGTDREGKQRLAELRAAGLTYRDDPSLAARYELPEAFAEGARNEAAWLREGAALDDVEIVDPCGALADWLDPTVPDWYAEISRREAVLPDQVNAEPMATQLWRVRQERAAYRRRLERIEGQRSGK